jgi:AAA domain
MQTAPPINPDELRDDYERAALDAEQRAIDDAAHAARAEHDQLVASTWLDTPLGPILAGDLRRPVPTILRRTDGLALLYAGMTHMLLGEFESGKTTAALAAVAETIRGGKHVLYVDFEDDALTFALRLRELGAQDDDIEAYAHHINPGKPLQGVALKALVSVGKRYRPDLIIIDGVTEAMALHGWNPDKMEDVARFYDLMPRRWDQTGAAVVMIDHVVKSKDDRGRYAIGSQHKMAGVNGAAYRFDAEGPLSPGRHGQVQITVVKDRPGSVRKVAGSGKDVGVMHLRPAPDRGSDALDVTIEAPSLADAYDRLNALEVAIIAWLAEQEEPAPQNRIEQAELGPRLEVRDALARLVDAGKVERTNGPRRSKLHRLVRPLPAQ